MSANPSNDDHELIMPFVNVTSVGGTFDDDSFTAGYECGLIDGLLKFCSEDYFEMNIHTENADQLDLIAMRHGFTMIAVVHEEDETWSSGCFAKFPEETVEA